MGVMRGFILCRMDGSVGGCCLRLDMAGQCTGRLLRDPKKNSNHSFHVAADSITGLAAGEIFKKKPSLLRNICL